MRSASAFLLAILLAVVAVVNVSAQSAESIWLSSSTTAYKTGETMIVAVYASSATPIQGFTFQIRYDPTCLKPVNAASTIPGMNGLSLPQTAGLVDASYASTTPQAVNGVLAEVRFMTLGACQTGITLESAALAIRNAQGFAAPVAGVTISASSVALTIDKEVVAAQPELPVTGSLLPLEPTVVPDTNRFGWIVATLALVFLVGALFVIYQFLGLGRKTARRGAALHIKRGPNAGKSYELDKLPFGIGRDPRNELCLNDPHILGQHARIFTTKDAFYLLDLGGNTFINGQAIKHSAVPLKPGDVVRLGKSALFVFG